MVTGNAWRDEETEHTLRMLELIGRTDVPVAKGAVFPLVRTEEETRLSVPLVGQVDWLGAWGQGPMTLVDTAQGVVGVKPANPTMHAPDVVPPMPEGAPHTQTIDEDAVHFLIRQVHAHPHQVTIYAAGPLTNIALAIRIDPGFAELTQGIALMGGSLNPQTDDPEFADSPRHEFNFWFDPEAAHIVLRAPWKKIVCTTVDISVKTRLTQDLIDRVKAGNTPAARYVSSYSHLFGKYNYLWDELAALAWLDPSLITAKETRYLDVDLSRGAGYGNTLGWTEDDKPKVMGTPAGLPAEIQVDLDADKFYKMFVDLLTAPTPKP
jgi:inosine-uridine nucleoside N-ribohydrolase